ncbi:hypothetical protein F5B19DRAFT_447533 [Rostrohypoxylon terebratum]|nr:hypothetical protein F5B19DRAFT_447533 [Rostrohypoxylon terebratum]
MLRLLRSRPNLLTLSARAHKSAGPVPRVMQVQRVKIRRKWFKPKNFILASCVYYVCYQVYSASVLTDLLAWWYGDDGDDGDDNDNDNENDEDGDDIFDMFLPIPFTTRVVESPPYKGSDPEWQAFIRVNNDRELLRSIQDNLAALVVKTAARSSILVQRCGKDMSLNKYWLNIVYPARPPPTFVQKGISIGEEIAITEEPIDTTAAFWVRRALWPYPITVSLWSFTGALVKQNFLHVAKAFGYNPNAESSPSLQQTINDVQQRVQKSIARPSSKASNSASSAKAEHGQAQDASDSSSDSTSPVEKRPAGSSTPDSPATSPTSGVGRPIPVISGVESNKPRNVKDIYGIENTQEHTKGPWMAFKQKFGQTWRPIQGLPPRGCIYVNGLVEITTPRAFITVDASAFWDPRTKTFDTKTTSFRLRNIRFKVQSPSIH